MYNYNKHFCIGGMQKYKLLIDVKMICCYIENKHGYKPMTKQETIEKIARDILWVETLEERKSDSLDFHELAVWQLKNALSAAYEAGKNAK